MSWRQVLCSLRVIMSREPLVRSSYTFTMSRKTYHIKRDHFQEDSYHVPDENYCVQRYFTMVREPLVMSKEA
jgi:hypothetical protein